MENLLTDLKDVRDLDHLRPIFVVHKLTMEELIEMEKDDLAKELSRIGVTNPIDQFVFGQGVNMKKKVKMLRDKYVDNENSKWKNDVE